MRKSLNLMLTLEIFIRRLTCFVTRSYLMQVLGSCGLKMEVGSANRLCGFLMVRFFLLLYQSKVKFEVEGRLSLRHKLDESRSTSYCLFRNSIKHGVETVSSWNLDFLINALQSQNDNQLPQMDQS